MFIAELTDKVWKLYLKTKDAELYKMHRELVDMSHEATRSLREQDPEKLMKVVEMLFGKTLNQRLVK